MTYFINNFVIIQTFIELEALFTVGKKFPPPLQECELPCDPTVIGGYGTFFVALSIFDTQRRDLLSGVLALVRPFGFTNPSNEVLTQLLMYGNKDFPDEINRNIPELTLKFIHETGRYD